MKHTKLKSGTFRSGYSFLQIVDSVRREMPPPSKTFVDKRVRAHHDKVGRKAKYKGQEDE